jgi:hypothetical protein
MTILFYATKAQRHQEITKEKMTILLYATKAQRH